MDGFCLAHSPTRQAQLAESRRKGGAAKSNAARARKEFLATGSLSPAEVLAFIGVSMRRLHLGRIESGVASAMAALGRAWFAGHEKLTLEDLRREVEELRALAGAEPSASRQREDAP